MRRAHGRRATRDRPQPSRRHRRRSPGRRELAEPDRSPAQPSAAGAGRVAAAAGRVRDGARRWLVMAAAKKTKPLEVLDDARADADPAQAHRDPRSARHAAGPGRAGRAEPARSADDAVRGRGGPQGRAAHPDGHVDRQVPVRANAGGLRVRRAAVGRPEADPRAGHLALGRQRRQRAAARTARRGQDASGGGAGPRGDRAGLLDPVRAGDQPGDATGQERTPRVGWRRS